MSEDTDKQSIARAHDRISKVEKDLHQVRSDVGELKDGQAIMAQNMTAQHADLKALITESKSLGLSDIKDRVQLVLMLFALIGGVVSGIVYVASNSNAGEFAVLKYQMERLYGSFGWEAKIKRGDNG